METDREVKQFVFDEFKEAKYKTGLVQNNKVNAYVNKRIQLLFTESKSRRITTRIINGMHYTIVEHIKGRGRPVKDLHAITKRGPHIDKKGIPFDILKMQELDDIKAGKTISYLTDIQNRILRLHVLEDGKTHKQIAGILNRGRGKKRFTPGSVRGHLERIYDQMRRKKNERI